MKRRIELLAPGGDMDSIKAAIAAGADAVYCGLGKYNARRGTEKISFQDLNGILRLAHSHDCKVFITLNIIIVETEIPDLIRYLNRLVNTTIDGVIVQDLGLLYLISKYFKGLKIHASTQLNTHNEGQIGFLSSLGAERANLSRELNMKEIRALTAIGEKKNLSTEVFVHGSYCISFSGLCYMSSLHGGKSGNRGRCSQPCRDQYSRTPQGRDFPLNLKDNSAWFDLEEIYDAGVASLKIEGRIKGFDYVHTVVSRWRKLIDTFYEKGWLDPDNSDLYIAFNRDFSNGYLKGNIARNMFIDNPRDYSIRKLSEPHNYSSSHEMSESKENYYKKKEVLSKIASDDISRLNIEKAPLKISISGKLGAPLSISVKTPDSSFTVLSEVNLSRGRNSRNVVNIRKTADGSLDLENLEERLKALNDTEYFIEHMDAEGLEADLFIPFKEFTSLKKGILFILNGSEFTDPVEVPPLKKEAMGKIRPVLSLLISSAKDIHLCNESSAEIYFQLPNCFKNDLARFKDIFLNNRRLIPWFPSVLIGEDYEAAVELLKQIQPGLLVTNNSGIAFEASERGIPWIAGPFFNIVNSFSLLCLKEKFNCRGAFISNELKEYQIKRINVPDNFRLYYSIYHPILLMISRQCFFHQVTGCEKESIDVECIQSCNRSSSIVNLANETFLIEKSEGNFNCIYNSRRYLNTDIVTDPPNSFSAFLIDLRDIRTETKVEIDKSQIIRLFEKLLHGDVGAKNKLEESIHPSTKSQYKKGI